MNIHHTRTRNLLFTALLLAPLAALHALDYPHQTAEPQKTGWPLTAEERAYVTEKPEHDRRPGRESNKHLPQLWPVVPSAGHFGGDSWLKLHEAHVKTVQANKGKIDVLLVGDSITIQWGESWKKHFPDLKAVNIGIGGDKTQNVLWRLDHGGVEGLQPQTIVLMIGNNNMFFTAETGIEAAAQGIEMCVKNLREKFPDASIIVAKILPAHAPGNRFYEDIKKTNAALDPLQLDSDPKVQLLDLTADFTHADGTLKKDLFTPDNIHLSPAGYAVYAAKLRPMLAPLAAKRSAESAPLVKAQARTGQRSVEGPAPPRWFNAFGTYGRNVLFWGSTERPDRSSRAVVIERREGEDGTWHTISPEIRDVDRWFDDEVHPGRSYSYRAYSLTGARRSEFTPVRVASPRNPNRCSLPVYELTLPEAWRNAMLEDPRKDVEVEGQFHFQGQPYPVRIRLHGASTRLAQKKSYRLEFLDRSPMPRPVTFLKAEPMDHTLQQEKLSCDMFRQVGAWVSQADYVQLFVNGRYEGVYLDVEPIRSPFKKNPELDPQGTLIRASTFQHLEGWEGLGELMGKSGSLEELTEFLRQINRTDRGEFESWLPNAVDWPRVRDFLALNVVCHRLEMEANDYFFYRPKVGKWSLIPWDHNNGNFGVAPFGNRVREPFIHIFSQAIQEIGWRSPYWYVLPSRIYQNDRLRAEYLDRLKELTTSLLLSGTGDAMIDRNFALLKDEYVVDPYRVAFEGPDPFLRSAADLKRFVRQHGERLLRLIEQERNRNSSALVISEFSFGAESGWVEIHNRGPEAVSLRGYLLVTKGGDGNREFPLSESGVLKPNSYTVVTCPRNARVPRASSSKDREEDDSRAGSIGADSDVAQPFPGFDPAGGFIALARRQPESRLERREDLVDFWHYGPQQVGRSYGRFGGEFAELEPTPGRENIRAMTR